MTRLGLLFVWGELEAGLARFLGELLTVRAAVDRADLEDIHELRDGVSKYIRDKNFNRWLTSVQCPLFGSMSHSGSPGSSLQLKDC